MNAWLVRFRLPIVFVLSLAFTVWVTYSITSARQSPQKIVVVPPTPSPAVVKDLKVYVTGAVVKSGVYTVREGARVEDALRAAGGPSPDANMARVNLALRVKDEMQVNVPKVGEPSSIPTIGTGGEAKMDVNTATAEDLDRLPGIGPTTAAKIIDYRSQKGNFKTIDELRDLKLVRPSQFEQIKEHITVD